MIGFLIIITVNLFTSFVSMRNLKFLSLEFADPWDSTTSNKLDIIICMFGI